MKKSLFCLFLLLSLSASSLFFYPASGAQLTTEPKASDTYFASSNNETDPITIGSSTDYGATSSPFQRKTFFAHFLHWVFYSNGTHMIYRWFYDLARTKSTKRVIRSNVTSGSQFSVWWDGTYVHYALSLGVNSPLLYRRGIINPNTWRIMWEDEYEAVPMEGWTVYRSPFVIVDSNGYPWIGYVDMSYHGEDGYRLYPCVVRATYLNGSHWSTPYILHEYLPWPYEGLIWWDSVTVLPLNSGKVYAVYTAAYDEWGGDYPGLGRLWNGTGWESEEWVMDYAANYGHSYSAVSGGNNIHLVFNENSTNKLIYRKRNSTAWEPMETLETADSTSYPVLSIDTLSEDLYCFWFKANVIYMKKYIKSSGQWTNSSTSFGTTFNSPNSASLTCFYQIGGRRIGVAWVEGIESPYNVMFAYYRITVNIGGVDWYYWSVGNNKAVIYFGGGVPYTASVGLYDFYASNEWSLEKEKFVEGLLLSGFDVLSNAHGGLLYYDGNQIWLYDVAAWLINRSYQSVCLFGFSGGGVLVAYEIQKDYANIFHAAVVASAPVNWTDHEGIYKSAQTANKAKVPTCFVEPVEDMENFYDQMLLYYNNMVVHREWHNWNGRHDPFPNTCKNHTASYPSGEIVAEAASNWYQKAFDVAVTNVSLYHYYQAVGQTLPLNDSGAYPTFTHLIEITVTVKNEGDFSETFNVTTYNNTSPIGTQTVTNLAPGAERTLTFTWEPYLPGYPNNKTEAWPYPTYVFSAEASAVPGETDTADNTYVDGSVTVKWPGDANGDGKVGLPDLMILSQSYNKKLGEQGYNPKADFNGDGWVQLADQMILSMNYGKGPLDDP